MDARPHGLERAGPMHPRFAAIATGGIVVRNLIPLVSLLWVGASARQFLLLSAFNLALGIVGIGIVGVAVSQAQEPTVTRDFGDSVRAWLNLTATSVVMALLLTFLFSFALVVTAGAASEPVFDAAFGWSALGIAIGALPGVVGRYQADRGAGLDEASRKRRDMPAVGSALGCGALLFVVAGWAVKLGPNGLIAGAVAATALFMLRDLRPDLLRPILRSR
ncbi:MAG TPA: hypothetical protein VFG55_08120 [Rhodanobacteraceae bacterium]|nr:hypothetical protein [Rhodanobacteraceae bacterium]